MTQTSLSIVEKVARHPRVTELRTQQQKLHARFVRDYGNDFMGTGDAEYDEKNGFEGVNRWTPVERKTWNDLTRRLHGLREALKAHYESV